MAQKPARSMANPVLLKPVDQSEGTIQVIIEIHKAQRAA